jgi:hypothetical protein
MLSVFLFFACVCMAQENQSICDSALSSAEISKVVDTWVYNNRTNDSHLAPLVRRATGVK